MAKRRVRTYTTTIDPRPQTPRAATQQALADVGLLRKPSQAQNDIEKLLQKQLGRVKSPYTPKVY